MQHRGLGFGKELVGHAIERAVHSGFRLLVAMILECNQRSIDLLLEFRFSISGRLPNAAKINGEYSIMSICLAVRRPSIPPDDLDSGS